MKKRGDAPLSFNTEFYKTGGTPIKLAFTNSAGAAGSTAGLDETFSGADV
jgi:hypothetical protein